MNKSIKTFVTVFAALLTCCPFSSAQVAVGNYTTYCPGTGQATSDTRNAAGTQVVHLMSASQSMAVAYMHDSTTGNNIFNLTLIAAPAFSLQRGNGNRLMVTTVHTPPSSSTPILTKWVTPNSALNQAGARVMVQLLNGYLIPIGPAGLPTGSTLNCLYWTQFGNARNCNTVISHINNIAVNGVFVGVDTSPASSCGAPCE